MYQHIQYLYIHKYGACNMYVSTCTLLSQSVSAYGKVRCGRDSNSLSLSLRCFGVNTRELVREVSYTACIDKQPYSS
jgi:hypothetical protein